MKTAALIWDGRVPELMVRIRKGGEGRPWLPRLLQHPGASTAAQPLRTTIVSRGVSGGHLVRELQAPLRELPIVFRLLAMIVVGALDAVPVQPIHLSASTVQPRATSINAALMSGSVVAAARCRASFARQ